MTSPSSQSQCQPTSIGEAVSGDAARGASFDHLVGAGDELRWDCDAECPGGCEIDGEIELGRLLDWQVGRLSPAQNLVDVVGGASVQVREVWSIGHESSRFDGLLDDVHRRESRAQCQRVDANPVSVYERVTNNVKGVRAPFERLDGGGDVLRSSDFRSCDFKAECVRRFLNLAHLQHGAAVVYISHDRQPAESGHNLAQQLQAFATGISLLER